tara:strand:- start:4465 stop:4866 length:402 start_codon:yes stop_codon:yes gene_type:complete
MKALMIVTLLGITDPGPQSTYEAMFDNLDECRKVASEIKSQDGVKNVVCVPHTTNDEVESKFEKMMILFIDLVERMRELEQEENFIINEFDHHNNHKCGSSLFDNPFVPPVLGFDGHGRCGNGEKSLKEEKTQ